MLSIKRLLSILLVALALAAGPQLRAQIIQDGSFEGAGYPGSTNFNFGDTPVTVNGWTFGGDGGTAGKQVGNFKWKGPGSDGVGAERHIELMTNHPTTDGRMYVQTTMTGLVSGAIYMLSFDAERLGGSGTVGVFLNGSTTAAASYTLNPGWATQTLYFTATGTSETLRFEDNSASNAGDNFGLDAISVVATTPEPNSMFAIAGLILGMVCVHRRRPRTAPAR